MVAGIVRNKERTETTREVEGYLQGIGDTHGELERWVAAEQIVQGMGCCASACDTEYISDMWRGFPSTAYLRLGCKG